MTQLEQQRATALASKSVGDGSSTQCPILVLMGLLCLMSDVVTVGSTFSGMILAVVLGV